MKKFILILAVVLLLSVFAWPEKESVMPSFTPAPITTTPGIVSQEVPFAAQAPFGGWDDPRQQDGCEEASVVMAMRWVRGEGLSKDEMLKEIFAVAEYEQANYGTFNDTNAYDTVERIFKGYYGFQGARAESDISTSDIKRELATGNLVLVPLNGQLLGNPYYTAPGPERHMLVIKGYDDRKDEFITNDPGTRRGEHYRYKASVLQNALFDYPTGDHVPATEIKTAMIVVKR